MKTWNRYEFCATNEQGQVVFKKARIANYDCCEKFNNELSKQFPGCIIVCIISPYEMKRK